MMWLDLTDGTLKRKQTGMTILDLMILKDFSNLVNFTIL